MKKKYRMNAREKEKRINERKKERTNERKTDRKKEVYIMTLSNITLTKQTTQKSGIYPTK